MMNRILVAVDDSPTALSAAGLAIRLARAWSAELNFSAVAEPGFNSDTLLRHVGEQATQAGIVATLRPLHGDQPFEALLEEAHRWDAELIVMGQSDKRRPGRPYVGSQTEHVLEFTDIPVMVVPDSRR